MHKDLELTENQLNLAKKVYQAIRKAGKAGVHFWDNYGKLSCYNAKKIKKIYPPANYYQKIAVNEVNVDDHPNIIYSETLSNFNAGNADDKLFAEKL